MKIINNFLSFLQKLFTNTQNQEQKEYLNLVSASKSYGRLPNEQDGDEDLYSIKDVKPLEKD